LRPLLEVFSHNVGLNIYGIAWLKRLEIGHLDRVWNDGNCQSRAFQFCHCQADSFNRNGSLEDEVFVQIFGDVDDQPEVVSISDRLEPNQPAGAIDVALHDVTAHARVNLEG
jgi:hypothetical protein